MRSQQKELIDRMLQEQNALHLNSLDDDELYSLAIHAFKTGNINSGYLKLKILEIKGSAKAKLLITKIDSFFNTLILQA